MDSLLSFFLLIVSWLLALYIEIHGNMESIIVTDPFINVLQVDKNPLVNLKIQKTLDVAVAALKSAGCFSELVAIPSAKVPIVKFLHIPTGLEGDISLYNRLARSNTHMLSVYCKADKRAAVSTFIKLLYLLSYFN